MRLKQGREYVIMHVLTVYARGLASRLRLKQGVDDIHRPDTYYARGLASRLRLKHDMDSAIARAWAIR